MIINLDPRAGSGDLKPLLEDRVTLTMDQMAFGDAAFDGHGPKGLCGVGVEIKKLDDVLACAIDKRFAAHQLPGMLNTYDFCYLLIEGRYGGNSRDEIIKEVQRGPIKLSVQARTPLKFSGFCRWLMTIQTMAGFYIWRSSGREDTAQLLVDLATWWAKPWRDHHAHLALDRSLHHRPDKALLTKPGEQRRMIGEAPGIGWEKSQRVLAHFGSVHAAVNASVEEWMKIEGVGRTMAERIYRSYRKDTRKVHVAR